MQKPLEDQIYMVDYVGIRYGRYVIYSLPSYPYDRSPPRKKFDLRSKDVKGAYSGEVTRSAQKRLQKSMENLLEISEWKTFRRPSDGKEFPFRLAFVTLTLSSEQGKITDKQIHKECFSPFMQDFRRKFGVSDYVWKAEKQKNGNLHYHITINKFIRYDLVRDCWNKHQNRLGFIDRFEAKYGHRHPNSTDVKSVRDDSDIGKYMAKYISKKDKYGHKLGIKVWDCSRNLKVRETRNIVLDNEIYSYIREVKKRGVNQVRVYDYCTIIEVKEQGYTANEPDIFKKERDVYIDSITM